MMYKVNSGFISTKRYIRQNSDKNHHNSINTIEICLRLREYPNSIHKILDRLILI